MNYNLFPLMLAVACCVVPPQDPPAPKPTPDPPAPKEAPKEPEALEKKDEKLRTLVRERRGFGKIKAGMDVVEGVTHAAGMFRNPGMMVVAANPDLNIEVLRVFERDRMFGTSVYVGIDMNTNTVAFAVHLIEVRAVGEVP